MARTIEMAKTAAPGDAGSEGGPVTGRGAIAAIAGMPPRRPAPRRMRFVLGGSLAVGLLLAGAGLLGQIAISERSQNLHANMASRLEALASGKAATLAAWLEGRRDIGRRLTHAVSVQLFIAELQLQERDPALAAPLAEQTPYMRQVMAEFADQQNLVGAYILGPDGTLLLADRESPPLGRDLREAATALLATGADWHIGAPREAAPAGDGEPAGLVVDIVQRIAAPADLASAGFAEGVGVLVTTIPLDSRLSALLGPAAVDLPGERVRLFGPTQGWQIAAGEDGLVFGPATLGEDVAGGGLPVADSGRTPREIAGLAGGPAFALAGAVAGTDWRIVQEMDREVALAPLEFYRRIAISLGLAAALLIGTAALALWWRQSGRHHGEIAAQYRDLAGRIERQRRLLQAIMDTTTDLIALKDSSGRYVYVNDAYAGALRTAPDALLGQDDSVLQEPATAALLADGARRALAGGPVSALAEDLALGGSAHHLHIAHLPVELPAGEDIGTLTVARDLTEIIEERREREQLVRQTVQAFVRAVELIDPWLLGHTRRLQTLVGIMGEAAGLDEAERRTLDLAASLSQIGKIFVPKHILAKPGRHTEAEARIMRSHLDHALKVIESVPFDLPVAETLASMHERLDGSGYPRGLAGDQIGRLARLLAIADVFCARTMPRSYRDRHDPAEVLHWLAENNERYDPALVRLLRELIDGKAVPLAADGDEKPVTA